MVDARAIALALGIVGAAFGLSALLFDTAAFGAAAGAAAIGAGVVALWISPHPSGPKVDAHASRHEVSSPAPQEVVAPAEQVDVGALPAPDPVPATIERLDLDTSRDDADETAPNEPEPSTASSLTDIDSQLFSEAYFLVALQSRLASARRHLRPVSVCLMEVTEGQSDPVGGQAPAGRVADAIRQTVREADIACRMDDGTYAVILEDTPENGAVWTVERTRRNLVSRFGAHTMWAGVACYPAHAFSGDELLEQARTALSAAQEWNQDRIEVAAVQA